MTYTTDSQQAAIALVPLDKDQFVNWKSEASGSRLRWVESSGFMSGAGEICVLPGADGGIEACLFGTNDKGSLYQLAALPGKLPEGTYRLDSDWDADKRAQASLGWGLGTYRFDRYKKDNNTKTCSLVLDEDIADRVKSLAEAQYLVRDLVNTPTEDLGPQQLEDAVSEVAKRFDAECKSISGDDLLSSNFPAIHAVGRASTRPPRLIELTWGKRDAPIVVLVGKGVCFDTGGLNLKPTAGMALMKKDMGGAAHALGVAQLVMAHNLPVRLKLLIPAVENSVSGNAYRPGDVIPTRKGLTVEIGNTDAEGRVILSDALTYASEMEPEVIIDFATLTGAARVGMGTDLPPLFSNDSSLSSGIQAAGDACEDPLWTLPLWQPYKDLIKSNIADISNNARTSFGGAITAALFLEHFVDSDDSWAHIDTFAWNQTSRPGRPEGGEALSLRAVFAYLEKKFVATG
ncbi:MAG TPA: leucyl aminopeptidase family protein [Xanthomonadales bacterium]|nr:leucyl aminopeptidase family protein [Xanthomonadales bacterium]